jgi:hypothetical protein
MYKTTAANVNVLASNLLQYGTSSQNIRLHLCVLTNYNNRIDKEAFLADLRVSSPVLDPPDDVDLYDNTLRDIVDQHAPLRKCQADQCFHGIIRTYRLQRDTEGIVSCCGSGPVCVFI